MAEAFFGLSKEDRRDALEAASAASRISLKRSAPETCLLS
jgi:hypothetical protein